MIGKSVLFFALLMAAASQPDVVVTRPDWENGLKVRLGATIRVPLPADNAQWAVVYPRDIVRPLTEPDRIERPNPKEGWRFETIARGSGEMTFTGFVPPGRSGADQPNPPRFVLKVTVR
jgi:hypothetical protein